MRKLILLLVGVGLLVSVFGSFRWQRDRALMEAIEDGKAKQVQSLLNAGANPDARGWPSSGWPILALHTDSYAKRTALMLAASGKNPEIVRLLLAKGADVHVIVDECSTAFTWAALSGHIDNVRLLLDAGAAENKQVAARALDDAAYAERPDVIRLLLSRGVDVNGKDIWGNTPLSTTLTAGAHTDIVKLLLKNGARLDLRTDDGMTALMHATQGGNIEMVKIVLAQRPDVNARDKRGMTALMYAVGGKNALLIKTLLTHGADKNAQDEEGMTALMFAAYNSDIVMTEVLLAGKVDIHLRDKEGKTALAIALYNKDTKIASLLRRAGATE